eukprot:jgi/Ulvmu1/9842/UM056_0083.1
MCLAGLRAQQAAALAVWLAMVLGHASHTACVNILCRYQGANTYYYILTENLFSRVQYDRKSCAIGNSRFGCGHCVLADVTGVPPSGWRGSEAHACSWSSYGKSCAI